MKSKTFKKKLDLNKTTLVNLNHHQMNGVYGGIEAGGAQPAEEAPADGTIFKYLCPYLSVSPCITDPPTLCMTCPLEN
jgi:hypothetical protein